MMQTKFLMNGTNVSVVQMSNDTALDYLPPKVYTIRFNQFTGYYLSVSTDAFQTPKRIYGDVYKRVNKCIETYKQRNASTGILMTGDKGTGKTLLMSLLANTVIDELRLPVILIREPFNGESFDAFIQTLGECCIVIDEFGKLYPSKNDDGPSQECLLSLFDGVDKTKRLIVLTENNEFDINEFMLNRPSRIFYHFRYKKLDEQSIKGYCADHHLSPKTIHEIIDLSRRARIFSFDMLQAIVEEHKRFGEPINDIIEELNIDIRQSCSEEIKIIKVVDKKRECERLIVGSTIVSRPVSTYDYACVTVQGPNVLDNQNLSEFGMSAGPRMATDSEDDDQVDGDEVCFESSDLAYETGDNLIYEVKDYIIYAKKVPVHPLIHYDAF